MQAPRFETPPEPVDGLNAVFTTSVPYLYKSVRVFRNGLLLRKDLSDGWVEDPPTKVHLLETPRVTDIIRLYYVPIP